MVRDAVKKRITGSGTWASGAIQGGYKNEVRFMKWRARTVTVSKNNPISEHSFNKTVRTSPIFFLSAA
jgi:hypothetical protein